LSLRISRPGPSPTTRCAFRNFLGQSERFFSIRDLAIEKPRANPGQRTTDLRACEPELGQFRPSDGRPASAVLSAPTQDSTTNRTFSERVECLHRLLRKIAECGIDGASAASSGQHTQRSLAIATESNDPPRLISANGEPFESSATQRGGQRREPDRKTGNPGSPTRRRPFGKGDRTRESTQWDHPVRPEQKPRFESRQNMPIGQRAQNLTGMHTPPRLLESQLQLTSPAFAAHRTKRPISQCVSQHVSRFSIQREAQPGCKSRSPPDSGGVIVKTSRVKNPKSSLGEIFESAFEIDDRHWLRRIRRMEPADQGIDTEIPTPHVLCQISRLHVGQGSGMGVRFIAKLCQIDLRFRRLDSNGAEAIVRNQTEFVSARFSPHGFGERAGIALDDEIDIDEFTLEQEITNGPSDEMYGRLARCSDFSNSREQYACLVRHGPQDVVETEGSLHGPVPEPRGCRNSTVSLSFARLTWV
jgi:hypothetical protein